jgi:acyl-CoA thioester hydrolase
MHTWYIRIYWEDTDAGGIVFYANYLKFFERARTEWVRSLGYGQETLRQAFHGCFVVSHTQTHYHRPARLDDLLSITTRIIKLGRVTVSVEQKAYRHDAVSPDTPKQGILLCDSHIKLVWVKTDQLQPSKIPPVLLTLLQSPVKASQDSIKNNGYIDT